MKSRLRADRRDVIANDRDTWLKCGSSGRLCSLLGEL